MANNNQWPKESYAWVFEKSILTKHPVAWAKISPELCRIRARGISGADTRRLLDLHRPMSGYNVPFADDNAKGRQRIAFPRQGRGVVLRIPFSVEYEWHVSQIIGEVALQYRAQNGQALSPLSRDTVLEWHDGARWRPCLVGRTHVDDVGGIWAGLDLHTFNLIPRVATRFRIRIARNSTDHSVELLNIDLREPPDYQKQHKGWMKPGDLLSGNLPYMSAYEDWLPDRDTRSIKALSLPRYLPAMIGNPDGSAQASMAFNGMVYRLAAPCPMPHRADVLLNWFAWGDPPRMLGDTWMVRRGVLGPGLGAWMEEVRVPIKIRIEAVPKPASGKETKGIEVVVRVDNLGPEMVESVFMVGLAISATQVGPFGAGLLGSGNCVAWRPMLSSDARQVHDDRGNVILEADRRGELIGADTDWGLVMRVRVPAGGHETIRLLLPDLAHRGRDAEYADKTWGQVLGAGAGLVTPDGEFSDPCGHLLAQQLCGIERKAGRFIMPYGAEASCYQDCLFGIEEHYSCQALAMFGYASRACRVFRDTFMGQWCKPENNLHIPYRLGRRATSGMLLYRLSGSRKFLGDLAPAFAELLEFAEAQTAATRHDPEPHFRGLFPEGWYGGDIRDVRARSVYNMTVVIRGLFDAAAGWRELGRHSESSQARFLASRLRTRLVSALRYAYKANAPRPFLPLNLLETAERPSSGNYYQLFANLVLETGVFPPGDIVADWITGFLEQDHREFLGLARYETGHDAIYSLGYLRHLLNAGESDRFLTGVRAYLYLAMDNEIWTAQETGMMPQMRRLPHGYYAGKLTDRPTAPLLAGSAIGLILIRHLLLHEPLDAEGQPTGTLVLFPAVPREWWTSAEPLRVMRWPSVYGDVTVVKESARNGFRLTINLEHRRMPLREIQVPVRLPEGVRLADVKAREGGEVCCPSSSDTADPVLVIPGPRPRQVIQVTLSGRRP